MSINEWLEGVVCMRPELKSFLEDKAFDYVSQYREVLSLRLREEPQDIDQMLEEHCHYSEYTYEYFISYLDEIKDLYQEDGLGLTDKQYRVFLSNLLNKFRKGLKGYVYKEMVTFLRNEIAEVHLDIKGMENTITKLKRNNPVPFHLIREMQGDLDDLKQQLIKLETVQERVIEIEENCTITP